MPNRTVYLPDDLDAESRRLRLNLSRVLQQAIRELAADRDPDEIEADVEAASQRAQGLGIDWSDFSLAETRAEADER